MLTKRTVTFLIALICLVTPVSILAQDTSVMQSRIQSLLTQISQLQDQLRLLQTQGSSTSGATANGSMCVDLIINLRSGLSDAQSNGEVSKLQQFLRSTGDYTYPEITGYYGPVTVLAVQKYQARNGIVTSGTPESTGYGAVGPMTRARTACALGGVAVAPIAEQRMVPEDIANSIANVTSPAQTTISQNNITESVVEVITNIKGSASKCEPTWEVCYEGSGLPGEGLAPYLLWDNPVDDDWRFGSTRASAIRADYPSGEDGLSLYADRTVDTGPAWIFRSDEMITYESGFEARLRVQILPQSDDHAVSFLYIDPKAHFSVLFSPDKITLNPTASQSPRPTAISESLDLTNGINEFLIRKQANSQQVDVFHIKSDGAHRLFRGKSRLATLHDQAPGYRTRITFGDDSRIFDDNDGQYYRGAYILDSLRYRRMITKTPRELPSVSLELPSDLSCLANSGQLTKPVGAKGRLSTELNAISGESFSLEFKARLNASLAGERNFHLSYIDPAGSYSFHVRPSGVSAGVYAKPVQTQDVKEPDGFNPNDWNTYRIVRPEQDGTNYVYLYINDSPTPLISHIKGGSSGVSAPMLTFGGYTFPASSDEAWNFKSDYKGLGSHQVAAEVEYIRWAPLDRVTQRTIDARCALPNGDIPAEVLTEAASSITTTGAVVSGSANPKGSSAKGYFRSSTTNPGSCNDTFGARIPSSGGVDLGDGTSAKSYSRTIASYSPNTTYYYCAIAENDNGKSYGLIKSFTTKPEPLIPHTPSPEVITNPATSVTSIGAVINGSINPNGSDTTAWFRSSATNPGSCNDTFGARIPSSGGSSLGDGTSAKSYSRTIASYTPNTTYYFCAIAENSNGKAYGTVRSFTTNAQ